MDTLQLGPFALPIARLPGLLALITLVLTAALVSKDRPRLRAWGTEAALVALVSARLGFVLMNWPAYEARPITVFYLWQGGFLPLAGAAALLPYTFWRLRRDTDALLRSGPPLVLAGAALALSTLAADWLRPDAHPIPELTLKTLDGRQDPLRSHLGQPLIVNLWASWCAPCRREMPMLVDEAARRDDVRILLVNQGESRAQVRRYLDEVGLDGAAIRLDPRNRVGQALDVRAFPTTLVYDAEGRLVLRRAGEISRAAIRQAVLAAERQYADQ